ncbi:hypothetical protein WJX81_002587 [Elliptochloris bilobata]|uniref:SMP-30/Gluconolactonase/LRE-like region domain-containing protein n=1 Tax=Elliptochloris bilobata TaxID=381761 RepID=A0AAW1RDF8_9CHLO
MLTRRQALKLGATCKALRARVDPAVARGVCRTRLLVVCSGDNYLREYDLATGASVNGQTLQRPMVKHVGTEIMRHPRRGSRQQCWPTCIAISPYDGDIYVCQYKIAGVIVLHGETLKPLRVMATDSIETPEGIAFSHNCTYVASAANMSVFRLGSRLGGEPFVPWGMVTGPDDNLYVAVDRSYEAPSYVHMPPPPDTGMVLRILLREDGTFDEPEALGDFCYGKSLRRPSGLCFDAAGNLLVTSGNDEVLRFAGPWSAHPGRFMAVLTATAPHPFDVVQHRGLVIVSSHACVQGTNDGNKPRLTVYDGESGTLLRQLKMMPRCEANMMAVE